MNRILHKHKWMLTGASGYELPPGELKVYRRCKCGEFKEEILRPAGGMTKEDLPIMVKNNCLIHFWRTIRNYSYFIPTDLGKIEVKASVQKCTKCNNIRIK